MTPEQATTLLALQQSLIDAVLFCSGVVAASILAMTWRG